MFDPGILYFTVEILIAEMLLLISYPKRKHFVIRYIIAVVFCLVLSYFFPVVESIKFNPFFLLLKFLTIFGYTLVGMYFCFEVSFTSMLATCSGGYAIQHISYNVVSLIANTSLLSSFTTPYSWFGRRNLLEVIFFPIIYLLMYFVFGRLSKKNKCYLSTNGLLNAVSITTVFICVGLYRFSRAYSDQNSIIPISLYSITCCLLALIIQYIVYRNISVTNENNAIKLVMMEEKKQYEMSKKNIELINIKCHDLKHQLSHFEKSFPNEEIKSIKDNIKIYDSSLKTGNDALDVLLTENSLRCSAEDIQFTFFGNGADLSFMTVNDLYSLIGNGLENAYEATKKILKKEKRVIGITIEKRGDFVTVNITNFYSDELVFKDGMPVTSKKDEEGYHGFGLKSMQLICAKYQGFMKVTAKDGVFNLTLTFDR